MNTSIQNAELARSVVFGNEMYNPIDDYTDDSFLLYFYEVLKRIDLIREVNKLLAEGDELVKYAENFSSDYIKRDDAICINVKRHNDYADIDDILDNWKPKLSKKKYEYLKETLDEEHVWRVWGDWIELEREYVMDRYKGEVDTKEEKELVRYLPNECGWYGRQGGYFGVVFDKGSEDLESYIEELSVADLDEIEPDSSLVKGIKDEIYDFEMTFKAIEWFFNWLEEFNKSLNWEAELKYRIEYLLENYEEEK